MINTEHQKSTLNFMQEHITSQLKKQNRPQPIEVLPRITVIEYIALKKRKSNIFLEQNTEI